jgi:hypothetical protein
MLSIGTSEGDLDLRLPDINEEEEEETGVLL